MLYPHGKGKYGPELKAMWKKLVPASGQAKTVQGELVRCIVRLGDESFRNGSANWDAGFEAMVGFLEKTLCDGSFDKTMESALRQDLRLIRESGSKPDNRAYVHEKDDAYTRVTDRVAEWCQSHAKAIPHKADPRLKR